MGSWRLHRRVLGAVILLDVQVCETWPAKLLEPRYDMCLGFSPHSIQLPPRADNASTIGRELSIFAASAIPESHMSTLLKLRAALLIEVSGGWTIRNPTYGKCTTQLLSKNVSIQCRTRGDEKRWSMWSNGALAQFQNTEVHHDFLLCDLLPIYPVPSRMSVQARLHEPEAEFPVLLQLELCRVDEPLLDVVFCTQPLFGFHRLAQELPFVIDDWLAYHLDHMGLQRANIYDVDGSFERVLQPWLRNSSFDLTYFKRWPSSLSDDMDRISDQYPYCTETWAYAHCLTSQRARSRWVMLLHAPDEYIRGPHPGYRILKDFLLNYVERMNAPDVVQVLRMELLDFARGGEASEQVSQERGSILEGSCQRADQGNTYVLIVDPREVVCAGPHTAFTEVGTADMGAAIDLEPQHLVVHHYVEMRQKDLGRCTQYHRSCNIPDDSILWAVPLLRNGKIGLPLTQITNGTEVDTLRCARKDGESGDRCRSLEGVIDAATTIEAWDCFTSKHHFQSCCCEHNGRDCQPGDTSFWHCCNHLLEHCIPRTSQSGAS